MISRFRMKIDALAQAVLILAVVLLGVIYGGVAWTKTLLILLVVWQFISALHLFYAYRYVGKLPYVRTALVTALSLPVWVYLIGWSAYLPVAGLVLWYFLQTVRDTITVYRRPRSFWDIS